MHTYLVQEEALAPWLQGGEVGGDHPWQLEVGVGAQGLRENAWEEAVVGAVNMYVCVNSVCLYVVCICIHCIYTHSFLLIYYFGHGH